VLSLNKKGGNAVKENHIVDIRRLDDKYSIFGKVNLVQLGRLECPPGHVIRKHTHLNWFELTCVVDGEGEVSGGETSVHVKKGDIFLSFPCEAHEIVSSVKNPLTFDHFAFYTLDPEYNDRLERLMACFADAGKRAFKSYIIKEMLDGCIGELVENSFFRRDYLEGAFNVILLEILKIFEVKEKSVFITDDSWQDPEKLCRTVKNYIDTHLFSIRSLTDLASMCGYNYSYLSSLFKKITGTTLSEYYRHRRFESAKLMIRENKFKIGEISNLLGYNSVYAFSKAFKDEYGVSPKKFYKEDCI
jgi:AraC-like DNA-binding protein/mannose-6-phosphate isomerase-like protein (cupin superfamily)